MNRPALFISLAALSALACGGPQRVDNVRFKNEAPVTVVNDRNHVPNEPKETKFVRNLYHYDGHIHRNLTRKMELRGTGRARNTNSMDEIPNSTWFTNRIGVRDLTPAQVARGPNTGPGPEAAKPWTILSSKVGGVSPGFIIEDAKGDRYLLKFDRKGRPEAETAVDVIVARLLWAIGYNVPEDRVVYFRKNELILSEKASVKDVFGNKQPLTKDRFNYELGRIEIDPDGQIRGLVSKFVSGKPIGGRTRDWPRGDDPNDVINHHERRDIRGQYAFFAWLEHADIKEDNTLDVFVEDPKNPNVKYVKHYLIDFGNALGVQSMINGVKFTGHAHQFDLKDMFASLVSLGIYRRPWEERGYPNIKGIGYLDSESLNPGTYHSYTPSYFEFKDTDRFDNFWASKILIRFTEEHFKAVVDEARFSDPQASEYMVRMLKERQRKVARYWFERVNPLDKFETKPAGNGYSVCFDDLLIKYDLDKAVGRTSYIAVGYDYDGNEIGYKQRVKATPSGRACLENLTPSKSEDDYTILYIYTDRKIDKYERPNDVFVPPLLVHLAKDPASGQFRVIGLRRK